MTDLPLIHELIPPPAVDAAFTKLARRRDVILFDSSLPASPLSRYAFLTADPFRTFEIAKAEYGRNPFTEIAREMAAFNTRLTPHLPPFQGGAAGLLSYELGHSFEILPLVPHDEFQIPAAVVGFYSWVLAWDLSQRRCWFIGHGFPEQSLPLQRQLAEQQLQSILKDLAGRNNTASDNLPLAEPADELSFEASAQFPLLPGIFSNFSKQNYLAAVERVREYIRAGDIFQANLSQRLLARPRLSPSELYLQLRRQNPAPFAGYFAHDDWAVLSSSPERFLKIHDGEVSTRPIKGTRQRQVLPEADLYTRDELRESEKDRSENVMIVDLLRNDLSRVCQPGSIRVPELCTVEAYETVSHLVSEVRGQLREGASFWDLVQATFPGGSITGAPKIRAMEIISELEQVARGPYCGSLFYLGLDGTVDSNILIRTITQRRGWLSLPVGGGIVAQSDPHQEYAETLHKARGMLRALPR